MKYRSWWSRQSMLAPVAVVVLHILTVFLGIYSLAASPQLASTFDNLALSGKVFFSQLFIVGFFFTLCLLRYGALESACLLCFQL